MRREYPTRSRDPLAISVDCERYGSCYCLRAWNRQNDDATRGIRSSGTSKFARRRRYGKLLVRAHDISESGFSFASEVELHIGDRILLGLRHDDDVYVEAEVRNVRYEGEQFIVGAERIANA